MKHRLPIFPAIVLGMVCAVAAGVFAARTRDQRTAASTAFGNAAPAAAAAGAPLPRVAPAGPPSTGHANLVPVPPPAELIARAGERMASYDSLSAKISLHSQVFGESLIASGLYLQGPPASRRLRLELKIKLGEKVCSLQQVSDGAALWIQETTLDNFRLGRVDLQEALSQLHQAGHRAGVDVLALGGLPSLLDSLNRSFDFQSVRTEKLAAGPTYVVLGVWKPKMLAVLMPDQKAAIESGAAADRSRLPRHMPNQVEVYLGRDNLFPYQIDYARAAAPGTHNDDDPVLSRMKMLDVHFDQPIDPAQFVYKPGEAVPADDTAVFVRRLTR